MSRTVYPSQAERQASACGLCGRTLGEGFYFVCHVCAAAFCYSHRPEKCDHRRVREAPRGGRIPAGQKINK